MMLKAKLVVVGGDAKAKEVSLRLPTVIGRGKDVSLTLPHPLVSRRHTEIFEKDGCLYVKDLGSLNGTYVNNRRIKEEQKLPPNHLLTLGNVTFRAVYEAQEPAANVAATQPTRRDEDETVNFEELQEPTKEEETTPASEDQSQDPTAEATPAKAAVEEAADADVMAPKISETKPAEAAKPEPAPTDDANSPQGSSIFSGEEDFISPEKSICVNSLEGLPSQTTPSSISFVGKGLLGVDGAASKSMVDSVDLDIGEAKSAASSESDPDLGSFLKKLPR